MNVLVLAPHTDDGQWGCGATIARMKREGGHSVMEVAFSFADDPALSGEWQNALNVLGGVARVGMSLPVRHFSDHRQTILDEMIRLRDLYEPSSVFVPSTYDTHQDHQTIRQEAFRAFKNCTILGYELPWNNIDFRATAFAEVTNEDVRLKMAACACYVSQKDRPYYPGTFIHSWAKMRGVQIAAPFAEAFEVIRWRM